MVYRKVWFITRPERDPKFHADAIKALYKATNKLNDVWAKNRDAHKRYEEVLAEEGLKRDNISTSGSGGRTWAAMLRTFGYVYLNSSGKLSLTKVGEALLDGKNVIANTSKQILTLQIPNAYFLENGFRPKFEEDFQIRPARFLIKLLNQNRLDYFITKEEITFFALTAKKDEDVNDVTEKIIQFRLSNEQKKIEMKKNIANVYDHRERSDMGARDFAAAHGDVAHTFMMLCDYTGLVEYIRGDALRLPKHKREKTTNHLQNLDERYPLNKRYLISPERFSENAGLEFDSYKSSTFEGIASTNHSKSLSRVKKSLSFYPLLQALTFEKIVSILEQELPPREAQKYAHLLYDSQYTSLNNDFVEPYIFEENDLVFEDKTAEILRALGFDVELRPKSNSLGQTDIEILLHVDAFTICIIDAKNYKKKFTLSANLASHMGSEYIPDYNGYKGKTVGYFGYVTARDWSGERNLKKISEKAKSFNVGLEVNGSIFSAKALLGFLDYCLDKNLPAEQRKELFISTFKNKGYSNVSELI